MNNINAKDKEINFPPLYWYLEVLKKYVCFKGRATRSEYWWFMLSNFIVQCCLIGITFVFYGIPHIDLLHGNALTLHGGIDLWANSITGINYNIFLNIYALLTLLPILGVSVRRIHDTGYSGWWYLINLIPFFGPIIMIIWFAWPGTSGKNKYN